MEQGAYTSLGDAFPQLINLTEWNTGRDPNVGGQNFTHCCLLAVNESLSVDNGFVVLNTPSYIQATVDELIHSALDNQFPCTAVWNGNISGAPAIEVPYSWLEGHCPGWQLSTSTIQAQWISPFVGFLLPAIIFCLSIPRRRKFTIYEKLFSLDFFHLSAWLMAPIDMILAWISAVLDIVIWLSMCFAFAGPMLMSGLYEAYLDQLLLQFIGDKMHARQLSLDMKIRLMFVLLCGNLDLDPDLRTNEDQFLDYREPYDSVQWPNDKPNSGGGISNSNSAWSHIEYLIHPLRTYRDMAVITPRQKPMHDITCKVANCRNPNCDETPVPRSLATTCLLRQTKTCLRTMLACQASFGAAVGAPVVFYLGTFVFTILATLTSLGDHDTGIEIAFGMWYMILPHIAIVSGLLLAGNNPNTLEGVLAHDIDYVETIYSEAEERNPLNAYYELAYESRYRPQWLWFRGRSKRYWIENVWRTYEHTSSRHPQIADYDMLDLRQKTTLGARGWAVVLGLTFLLLETPFVLAFLTAFWTPRVGVSCRSLTFTVHAINQLCLMCLWFWAWAGPPEHCPTSWLQCLQKGSWLEKSGFYTPSTNHTAWRKRETRFSMQSVWAVLWFSAATILGLSSVFVSVGGTLMQLIGVYRSDLCDLSAEWWTKPHDDVQIVISANSALDIKSASSYWLSTGIAATAFLAVVCFGGWWYQRRLRGRFRELVGRLGEPEYERDGGVYAVDRWKAGETELGTSTA